jgi:Fur family transcriptional regulator, ferric uptake regulator
MQDQELRNVGLKVTVPRMKILKILEDANQHHMSAEDVFKRLMEQGEDVGLATVYRVLIQFETAGLIKRHNFESGHSVYEINQGEHHDHLVCQKCGAVAEFYDETIEKQQSSVAEKLGFEITDHNHTIYGICQSCQKAG